MCEISAEADESIGSIEQAGHCARVVANLELREAKLSRAAEFHTSIEAG